MLAKVDWGWARHAGIVSDGCGRMLNHLHGRVTSWKFGIKSDQRVKHHFFIYTIYGVFRQKNSIFSF